MLVLLDFTRIDQPGSLSGFSRALARGGRRHLKALSTHSGSCQDAPTMNGQSISSTGRDHPPSAAESQKLEPIDSRNPPGSSPLAQATVSAQDCVVQSGSRRG